MEFLQRPGEDGYGGMEGDNGIVMEDVCEDSMQNLGGRLVLMLMRAGILRAGSWWCGSGGGGRDGNDGGESDILFWKTVFVSDGGVVFKDRFLGLWL